MMLTDGDRRALRLGACVVICGIAAASVPRAWRAFDARFQAIREHSVIADRLQRSVRELPRTRAELAATRLHLARYDSAAVQGDTHAVAGANLAELVSSSAMAAEAQMTSVQIVPARPPRAGLDRVTARASVTGDLEAIAVFIHGLEAGPELLAIRAITLNQPDLTVTAGRRETVRADVEIDALYRPVRSGRGH